MPGIQKALKLYDCCYIAQKLAFTTLKHWSRRSLETGIVCVHMRGGQRSATEVALKSISSLNLEFTDWTSQSSQWVQEYTLLFLLPQCCAGIYRCWLLCVSNFCLHTVNLSLVPYAYKASTLPTALSPGSSH